MDLLESLLTFFVNYGWPGIFAILLIAALFFGAKYFDNKADKRNSDLQKNLLETLPTSIITAYEKIESKRIDNSQDIQLKLIDTITHTIDVTMEASLHNHLCQLENAHKESEDHRNKITSDISDKLWDMMYKFNSLRAIIMEIHNGGVNLNRLSFLRYDVTYEKQDKNILPVNNEIQNLPASNLEVVCKDITNAKHGVVIYRTKDIENLYNRGATVLYSDLTNKLHASNVIYSGIYNDENTLYAIICLEYTIINKKDTFSEKIIDEIEIAKYTSEISQLYKYAKKF